MHYWISTNDPPRLLGAVMQHYQGGGAFISLEGGLAESGLDQLDGAVDSEMPPLLRNTAAPRMDFVAAPLSPSNVAKIVDAVAKHDLLSEDGPLIHVQIAVGERLVFGAYDSFSPNCTFADGIPLARLADMQANGLITEYAARDA